MRCELDRRGTTRAMRRRCLAAACVGILSACAAPPRRPVAEARVGGLRVTLRDASFDGTTLRGRILLGSPSGARVIRIRPPLTGGIDAEAAPCDGDPPLPPFSTRGSPVAIRQPAEVVLPVDTWYGRDLGLGPFQEPVPCALFTLLVPVDLPDRSGHAVRLELRARRGGAVELLRAVARE